MSDYGVFEASSTDGHEEEQQQRQAQRDLGRAIEAAREGFGGFLGAATDKDDYKDRLALVMNDLMQKVADSGVMPVPGVMRKVKAALRPEFRKQASVEDLRSYVESKGLTTSDKDNGFTFPTADGAKGHIYENRAGDIVVQTLIGGSGGGIQSNYSQDETELVKEWIDRTASRKQTAGSWKEVNPRSEGLHPDNAVWKIQGPNGLSGTVIDELRSGTDSDWSIFGPNGPILYRKFGEPPLTVDEAKKLVEDHINSGTLASHRQAAPGFNPNISDDDLLGGLQIAEVLNHDGSNQAKVDELRAEVEARGLTPLKTSRRKVANDYEEIADRAADDFERETGMDPYTNPSFITQYLPAWASAKVPNIAFDPALYEELEMEANMLGYGYTVEGKRKRAGVDSDVNSFVLFLQGIGYRMPKDAGYPGQGGELDEELYDYFRGDQNKIDEVTKFLQEKWDYYAYGIGGSRKQAFAPGDKVKHTDDGETGTVYDVHPDEIEVDWNDGTTTAVPESDLRAASRKQAFSEQLGVHLTDVFESAEAGGGWRPITGERLDWMKGDLEFYGGSGFFNDWSLGEDGEQEVLSFDTSDDAVVIDAAWAAVDYAAGILGSRKQASDVNTEDQDVLQFFYQFEDEGLDVSASGDEQWEWLKSNIDYDTLQDAIDQANEYGEVSRSNIDSMAYELQQNFFGSRKQASDASYEGWTARIIYDEDDFEYAETTTPSGEQADSIYPMDGSYFESGELREALEELAREWGDDAYSGTYQYNSSRKTALDIDGSWEEELPGIGYASCTPKAGGGFELYMWSDSKQSEALDIVPSSEEARRIWQEWRGSDTPPAGNAFNTDDNYFLGHVKHAGGTDFATFSQGSSAQEAFNNARAEAKQMYGDDGYTGSIAEKDSFEMASQTPMTEEEAKKFIWGGDGFGKFDDKWGPAGCIELDTGGFVFFGIAST